MVSEEGIGPLSVWTRTAHGCDSSVRECGVHALPCGWLQIPFDPCALSPCQGVCRAQKTPPTVRVAAVVVGSSPCAVSSVGNAVFFRLADHSLFSLGLLEKQQRVLCLGQTFLDPLAPEVLMLPCLSVADVAAIACGREFLVNSSRVLLDTMLQLLGDLKPGQCTKLKVYAGRQ